MLHTSAHFLKRSSPERRRCRAGEAILAPLAGKRDLSCILLLFDVTNDAHLLPRIESHLVSVHFFRKPAVPAPMLSICMRYCDAPIVNLK